MSRTLDWPYSVCKSSRTVLEHVYRRGLLVLPRVTRPKWVVVKPYKVALPSYRHVWMEKARVSRAVGIGGFGGGLGC